jgi:hypothetical protein
MPKKTKKDKLIAEYRRKLSTLSPRSIRQSEDIPSEYSQPQMMPDYQLQDIHPNASNGVSIALSTDEFTEIKKDLVRTLVLTLVIFICELALWKIVG